MTVTVITASAGSGKTYRLTEVLSERLARPGPDGLPPLRASEIIATTFTVRAASDLVEKTQQRLLDDGNITAAEEIRSALIGTVNSVAGRIVSEYAIDAGASPQLRVLDEAEQKKAFHTAADDLIAAAEAEHRDLLIRTGHDGDAQDDRRFGVSTAWAALVNEVVDAARQNQLGAEELRASAEASVAEFLSVLPAPAEDRRAAWRDQVVADSETLHLMLGVLDGDTDRALAGGAEAFARFPIATGSRGNVEGSILTLRHYLRVLGGDGSATAGTDAFARVPWSRWATVASAGYAAAGGGKKPGKVPLQILTSSSAALVSDELLANRSFQDDISTLIRLVFDTAIASLEAYAEFKDRAGVMDFVDQEVRALSLLQSNPRVRSSIASRYRLLAVDEFQDTSPVQLALFMELAQLVDDVFWVGDRKQAIYGFRGADPELMDDVFAALVSGTSELGRAATENLAHSWRSSQPPLDLSNALFRSVFAEQPEEQVVLTIPSQRANLRDEGGCEVWVPDTDTGKSKQAGSRLATTIADGVADLLVRAPRLPRTSSRDDADAMWEFSGSDRVWMTGPSGVAARGASPELFDEDHRAVQPGDIAVLVRSNAQVTKVVDGLLARGVPATGSSVALLQTREGQYVRAGLAAVVDPTDTIALAELVSLLPDHARRESWFEDAVRIVDRDERFAHPQTWWEDETLQALGRVRYRISDLAPSQLLLEVMDALDLPQRIKGWSAPAARLATLDGLRQLAREYEDAARSTRSPVSAAGLLTHLMEVGNDYDYATAHGAVLVTTMHQSKGLQWPVVISGVPQKKDFGHRAVSVQKASSFDVLKPLAGRSVRFLPRVLVGYGDLAERLSRSAVVSAGTEAERRETARLFYVALTRAETVSVMAFATPTGEENALVEAVPGEVPLLEWDEPGLGNSVGAVRVNDLRGGGGAVDLPVVVRKCALGAEPRVVEQDRVVSSFSYTDVPLRRPADRVEVVPARFTASKADSVGIEADVRVVATLGEPVVDRGGVDWDLVGEAVHTYLGIPHSVMPEAMARDAAERIVERWVVGDVVSADTVIEAGRRWAEWVEETYPGAQLLTEQPIAWRNEHHQVMEGWIDTRIALPDGGHVLVDHKTYPGTNPVGHVRENYLGQLEAYSAALEASTGTRPREVLVHLPLRGEVVGVVLSADVVSSPGVSRT